MKNRENKTGKASVVIFILSMIVLFAVVFTLVFITAKKHKASNNSETIADLSQPVSEQLSTEEPISEIIPAQTTVALTSATEINSENETESITAAETTTVFTEQPETGISIDDGPELIGFPEDDSAWKLICLNMDHRVAADTENKLSLSYVAGSSELMDSRAAVMYDAMYNAAKADGYTLTPCSGYRSYSTQEYLYNEFLNEYLAMGYSRSEAEALTSRRRMPPGSSEHNIGICMDIILADSSQHFETWGEYAWLSEHAAEYGFILRYPEDKTEITGVKFEPWHWRYVGTENAAQIKASGLCLEEFLGYN